eukprot:scaffold191152_cov27-Tisochrysis_lutea.AAC.1
MGAQAGGRAEREEEGVSGGFSPRRGGWGESGGRFSSLSPPREDEGSRKRRERRAPQPSPSSPAGGLL